MLLPSEVSCPEACLLKAGHTFKNFPLHKVAKLHANVKREAKAIHERHVQIVKDNVGHSTREGNVEEAWVPPLHLHCMVVKGEHCKG